MNLKITVEREGKGGLWKQVWEFWYFDGAHALVLDRYTSSERTSKKHAFRPIEGGYYNRLDARESSIAEAGVIIPADVAEEAMRKFSESLRVITWSQRETGREGNSAK